MWKMKKHIMAVLLTLVMLAVSMPIVSYATSTQQRLDEAQKKKEELEQQKKDMEKVLDELQDVKADLKGELSSLNKKLTEVSEHLADLEEQIRSKEQEIAETTAALEAAKEKEIWQYDCMKKRMQFMYEEGNYIYLEALFSAVSYADFMNFSEYFEQLVAYDRKMLEEYAANRIFIAGEEERLILEKTELDVLKLEAEVEQSKVAGLIGQTSKSIAKYSDQIEDAEAKALAYEAEIKKQEEDIVYLRKKIAEEIALSQAAANAAWRDISEVSFAEGDRYLLANLIYCEAGGESYAGQLAVGAVVINRVLSSKYPETVVGVIYQNKQFSPVGSGRLDLALASNKATAGCYRAADEAMSGITNVGSCLYFRTPIEGLTGINIGGHVFY